MPAQFDIPDQLWLNQSLEFQQKRALNIIFPAGEYATNLIIANVETLSQNDSNTHSFSSDGHEFGEASRPLLCPSLHSDLTVAH